MKPTMLMASVSALALHLPHSAMAQDINPPTDRKQADEIVVTANRPNETGIATKTAGLLVEVPQSVSIVTRDEMDLRGVQAMPDALRYVAGVQPQQYGIDSRRDNIAIRGFDVGSSTGNQYFDGLRSQPGGQWTFLQYDAYNLERVEVLKGPSAVLFGAVTPGGMVNQVTKRPKNEAGGEITGQFASHGQWRGTVDTTGPLNDSSSLRYRVVGMYRDGGSEVEYTDLGRWFVAPSLTWQPSLNTTLTVLGHYQKDFGGSTFQFLPLYGTGLPNPYGSLEPSSYLGEPNYNFFDRDQWAVGYGFVQQVTDNWQLRQNARYTKIQTDYGLVVAYDLYAPDTIDWLGISEDDPGMYRRLTRGAVKGHGSAQSLAIDTQSEWKIETGKIEHTILAGIDFYRNKWKQTRHDFPATPVPDLLDIFNPVYAGGIDDSEFYAINDTSERNRQI
ncbi:MAG: TonB-dependent siderophore receptor, partial [Sphingomonadaceae bacterium]